MPTASECAGAQYRCWPEVGGSLPIVALLLVLAALGFAQPPSKAAPLPTPDISGMYSFVHEGEFVQIEVNDGKVTGLVSRFRGDDLEKADFVDQYFEQAQLDQPKLDQTKPDQARPQAPILSFRTKPADGTWFEFSGAVERGPGKDPTDEAYWQLRGSLTEHLTSKEGKQIEKTHELTMKSFPQDSEANPGLPKR